MNNLAETVLVHAAKKLHRRINVGNALPALLILADGCASREDDKANNAIIIRTVSKVITITDLLGLLNVDVTNKPV